MKTGQSCIMQYSTLQMRLYTFLLVIFVAFFYQPVQADFIDSTKEVALTSWNWIINLFGWGKKDFTVPEDERLLPMIGSTEIHDSIEGYRYFIQLRTPTGTSAEKISLKSMGRSMIKIIIDKHFYTVALAEKLIPGNVYIPNVRKEYVGNDEWTLDFIIPSAVTGARPLPVKARDVALAQEVDLETDETGHDQPDRVKARDGSKKKAKKATDAVVLRGSTIPSFD